MIYYKVNLQDKIEPLSQYNLFFEKYKVDNEFTDRDIFVEYSCENIWNRNPSFQIIGRSKRNKRKQKIIKISRRRNR